MEWFYVPPDRNEGEPSSHFEEFSVSFSSDAPSTPVKSHRRNASNAAKFEEFTVSVDSPQTYQNRKKEILSQTDNGLISDDPSAVYGPPLEALTAFRDAIERKNRREVEQHQQQPLATGDIHAKPISPRPPSSPTSSVQTKYTTSSTANTKPTSPRLEAELILIDHEEEDIDDGKATYIPKNTKSGFPSFPSSNNNTNNQQNSLDNKSNKKGEKVPSLHIGKGIRPPVSGSISLLSPKQTSPTTTEFDWDDYFEYKNDLQKPIPTNREEFQILTARKHQQHLMEQQQQQQLHEHSNQTNKQEDSNTTRSSNKIITVGGELTGMTPVTTPRGTGAPPSTRHAWL